jgi:membrane-bound ClpP family serine protease
MKGIAIVAAVLLLIAMLHLPIGYYRIMRIGVTIAAILLIRQELKKGINTWVILFGIITILFNPIFPVYLGTKSTWLPIDLISGATFLIFAFTNKKND